jgi:PEP-CTERM motif-containing protein
MFRNVRGLFAAAALLAGTAGTASATSWGGNGSWCGGSGFSTCFSVDLSWNAVAGTTLTVTLKLTNENPAPGLKWKAIGLDNLSNAQASLSSYTSTGPAGWAIPGPNDFSGGPFIDPTASSNAPGGGENPGLAQRTWTFTLTMNGALSATEWNDLLQAAGVGLHAGGLDPCPSTKVVVRDNLAAGPAYGVNTGPPSACDQPSPPTEITPEPATLSLMALGLVGIAAVGVTRRRKV